MRDKVREGQKERGRWETRERKKERWTERGKKNDLLKDKSAPEMLA